MSKHTPGPWIPEQQFGTDDVDCGIDILQCRDSGDFEYRGSIARVYDSEHIDGISIAERNANALLIAAAPDLLEALRRCVGSLRTVSHGGEGDPDVEFARAAIAKAIGEQHNDPASPISHAQSLRIFPWVCFSICNPNLEKPKMNFPGENKITFSKAALDKILLDVLARNVGESIRIIECDYGYGYSDRGCTVTFTTDPEAGNVDVPKSV